MHVWSFYQSYGLANWNVSVLDSSSLEWLATLSLPQQTIVLCAGNNWKPRNGFWVYAINDKQWVCTGHNSLVSERNAAITNRRQTPGWSRIRQLLKGAADNDARRINFPSLGAYKCGSQKKGCLFWVRRQPWGEATETTYGFLQTNQGPGKDLNKDLSSKHARIDWQKPSIRAFTQANPNLDMR